MLVRRGLAELAPLLAEVGSARPLLVSSERWRHLELPTDLRFYGVRSHAPVETVQAAIAAAGDADGVLALGGGSAIDTGKAVSAARRLPLVSVPTTYAGAEWTPYFGIRDEARRTKSGGAGAILAGAVYEPELMLDLPRAATGGTAMNALAHCAEALYVDGHNPEADEHALAGARLISEWLPQVLDDGHNLHARTRLLDGACEAGAALGGSGLALGHALAQAVGGLYGLPHGALNAVCLAPALRFNASVAADAIARVEGLEPARDVQLARASGRAETRVAQEFVRFARERLA